VALLDCDLMNPALVGVEKPDGSPDHPIIECRHEQQRRVEIGAIEGHAPPTLVAGRFSVGPLVEGILDDSIDRSCLIGEIGHGELVPTGQRFLVELHRIGETEGPRRVARGVAELAEELPGPGIGIDDGLADENLTVVPPGRDRRLLGPLDQYPADAGPSPVGMDNGISPPVEYLGVGDRNVTIEHEERLAVEVEVGHAPSPGDVRFRCLRFATIHRLAG